MTELRIAPDDLTHPAVLALIEHHLREAFANSPPGSAFAFDLTGLRDPAVTLWSAWDGDALAGIAALRRLSASEGEVKSMRTAPGHERRGVALALLERLILEAKKRGFRVLKLETGTNDAYAAARALYERRGFRPCDPFGDYELTEFNRCYSLAI